MALKSGKVPRILAAVGSATAMLTGMLFMAVPASAAPVDNDPYWDDVPLNETEVWDLIDSMVQKNGAFPADLGFGPTEPQSDDAALIQPFASGADGVIMGPFGPISGPGYSIGPHLQWWEYGGVSDHNTHTLGPFILNDQLEWCVDFSALAPQGAGTLLTNNGPKNFPNVANGLKLSPGGAGNSEMGYLIRMYGKTNAMYEAGPADQRPHMSAANAAVSIIAHSNYEVGDGVAMLDNLNNALANGYGSQWGPDILNLAINLVSTAKKNAGEYFAHATFSLGENKQTFTLEGIGMKRNNTTWVPGIDLTVSILGDVAKFETTPTGTLSADGKVWTGKTASTPLSFEGVSTANGDVTVTYKFGKVPSDGINMMGRPATQTTILYSPTGADPKNPEDSEGSMVFDFQPMLISNVDDAGAKVISRDDLLLKDSLSVFADPAHKGPTGAIQDKWLGVGRSYPGNDDYKPLPVTFTGKAYKIAGERPQASEITTVPNDAVLIAETEFTTVDRSDCEHTATSPCEYEVKVAPNAAYDGKPGFVVWVWDMKIDNQPHVLPDEITLIANDWSDKFGIAEEQSVIQWEGEIESNIKIHPTNNNTYLVDDVWISGLPKDYGKFTGGFGFDADSGPLQQHLYFWEGLSMDEVTSLDGAMLIASVDIDGKNPGFPSNGFFPSVGDMEFKLQRDADGELKIGTYQFVHEFKASEKGRVGSFTSQVPDKFEMYEVTANPTIGTTAMGEIEDLVGANEDVTITDVVCYTGLKAGKEYTLEGVLMDQATGKPLLVDGKQVEGKTVFTPTQSDGCVEVVFEFNASALAGTTVVVFEDLYLDGIKVTSHADIEDKGQTVYIPEIGTTAKGPDGGSEVKPGPVTITDTVCWTNLSKGKEYELKGILMSKASGEALVIDGKEITSTKTFIAEDTEGCVDIEFEFDASALKGREIVVFENLYREDVEIATHADINDKGQTIKVTNPSELEKTGAIGLAAALVGGVLLASGGLVLRRKTQQAS